MVDLLKCIDAITTFRTSLEAMAMLSKGEKKNDVIIISVHSSNLDSFNLLAQYVTLDIVSLLNDMLLFCNINFIVNMFEINYLHIVCDEFNELLAKKTLTCLFLQNPLNEEILKYLWQFVLRRKIKREKARKGSEDGDKMIVNDVDTNNIDGDNEKLFKETNVVPNPEEHRNKIHEFEDNIIPNGNTSG
ncbi:hypothetical protein H5410_051951 [Solanum commersonii]|uniref:Uncharacterized protein n=1 Tax=Solanum commersonii TaxID=4109 RepID=A0A9J5X1Z4_SOLCO|nr:hypothetical protein H5410_051951 [Solanum commersonii]